MMFSTKATIIFFNGGFVQCGRVRVGGVVGEGGGTGGGGWRFGDLEVFVVSVGREELMEGRSGI